MTTPRLRLLTERDFLYRYLGHSAEAGDWLEEAARRDIDRDIDGAVRCLAAAHVHATLAAAAATADLALRGIARRPDPPAPPARPTIVMHKVSLWLATNPGATQEEIVKAKMGRKGLILDAIRCLDDEGYVKVDADTPRRHWVIAPFDLEAGAS